PTLFPKLVAASSRQAEGNAPEWWARWAFSAPGATGEDSFRLLWMGQELTMDLL
ncbi:unnamed protein product, partial [Effrenium voratum]